VGSLYENYKKAFWIGAILPAIQQFTGINAIMYYAPLIFGAGGMRSNSLVRRLILITMVDNFFFTLVSAFVSDRLGRKFLFILGSVGCCITLLMAAIGASQPGSGEELETYDWIFAIGVYLFIAFFGISHGPVW